MADFLQKGWKLLYQITTEIVMPISKEAYAYIVVQPWWPGVRFLLCSLLVIYIILRFIQLKYFKSTKRKHHSKTKSRKKYIYETENKRMASIPKKYTNDSTNFISSTYFLNHWATQTNGSQILDGYKKRYATSGCYLILIADKKSTPSTILNNYSEIYAGQSVNIAERVHQHFTGHGNGDVYADVKYGKYVFVKLFPCSKEKMNDLECTLIERFNGLDSYNRTAGGAKKRKKLPKKLFIQAD